MKNLNTKQSGLWLFFFVLFMTGGSAIAQSSNALQFDGNDDKVEIPDTGSLDLVNSYTLECWIKPEAFASMAGIISKYHSGEANGYLLRLGSSAPYSGIGFDGMETVSGIITAGVWCHIAAVNDNGTRHLYVNGVEIPLSGTPIDVIPNDDKLTLGMDYEPSPRYFTGAIDEVRIWNIARTQNEIWQTMYTFLDPSATGLVAYYKMNQGTAGGNNAGLTLVKDATDNQNNGTAVNFTMNGNDSNWVNGMDFPGSVLYVDSSSSGTGTGNSWQNAFSSLSDALIYANGNTAIDSVLVAEGIYHPSDIPYATGRDATFLIRRGGLKLMGGYPSGGGERNPQAHPVYLDGNINNPADNLDNNYHVMVIAGLPAEADSVTVDGFTFRNGYAAGDGNYTYNDTSIGRSYAGGLILINNGNSEKITVSNNIFTDNTAVYGGGMVSFSGNPRLINVVFSGNHAMTGSGRGAGMYIDGGAPYIQNSVFEGNISEGSGGGMYNYYCSAVVANSTFCNNSGGAIANEAGSPSIKNSIIWGNGSSISNDSSYSSVTYSLVEGGYAGEGNLSIFPLLADMENPQGDDGVWGTDDDGLVPTYCSVAVNAGNNTDVPGEMTADIAGNPRIYDEVVDMGAYELQSTAQFSTLYVDDLNGDDTNPGTNWDEPLKTISHALELAQSETGCFSAADSILVAKGTYYPTGTQNGTDRDATFALLRGGLKLLGGYPNGGGERDSEANPVYLDGDIHNGGYSSDNSYHLMVIAGIPTESDSLVVDGFIFRNGFANNNTTRNFNGQEVSRDNGGGIVLHNNALGNKLVIRNCTFTGNYAATGGGLLNHTNTSPLIRNCIFTANTADAGGGMVNYNNSAPVIEYCDFINNTSESYDGGGMYNDNSSPSLTACLFSGNQTNGLHAGGAGMKNNASSPVITNCIFADNAVMNYGKGGALLNDAQSSPEILNSTIINNTANEGNGIYNNAQSSPLIRNSIIWNNDISNNSSTPVLTYNLIQGGYEGEGNIDADPWFRDISDPAGADGIWRTADDGLLILPCSPAIDTGSMPVPAGEDFVGNPRIGGGTVDMGAYELQDLTAFTALYVDGLNGNDENLGISWEAPLKTLSRALELSQDVYCYAGVEDIKVAEGIYYPVGTQDGTDRDTTFLVKRGGLKLLGGYPAGGGERNPQAHPVYLDGNINNPLDSLDNSHHVMVIAGIPAGSDSLVIDGFVFRNGHAGIASTVEYNGQVLSRSNGGGLAMYNNAIGENLIIRNCIFTANYAISGGGMLNHTNPSPVITNCTFTGNTAGSGAGLYNYNSASPLISDSGFTNNESQSFEHGGGGIFNDNSSPSITNCSFSENEAHLGGGMYNIGTSVPVIVNCLFSNNNAQGGGIFNQVGSDTTIRDCVFLENSNSGLPAIQNNNASFLIINNLFIDYNANSIINSSFVSGTSEIYNNTIYGDGIGTAIFNTNSGSNIRIKNNIIWSGGGVGIAGNSSPVVTHNIIRSGYDGGSDNTDASPLFINPENPLGDDGIGGTADDGLVISACSPAVNAGSNTDIPEGVTEDITGNPRIYGGIVDLGAYEVQTGLQPSVLYVDAANGDDDNPGTGWNSSFKTLSHALNIIQESSCYATVDSILVAKGTYYPDAIPGYTLKSFLLLPGVKIYGGFQPGGVGGWEARELPFSGGAGGGSILSGDVDGNGILDEGNAYHVIIVSGDVGDAELDGFTITGGNASVSSNTVPINGNGVTQDFGGGIFMVDTSLVIKNCIIKENAARSGGGIYTSYYTHLDVSDCVFTDNTTSGYGGAIHKDSIDSSLDINRCVFEGNTADSGGAVANTSDTGTILNSIFTGNTATNKGGAIYDEGAAEFTNSTFYGNTANSGGALYSNTYGTLTNSIVYGNSSGIMNGFLIYPVVANYSVVQQGYSGQGNLNADPLFVNPDNPAGDDGIWGTPDDGLFLQPASPALNTGDPQTNSASYSVQVGETDITGTQRIRENIIDMGAYESLSSGMAVWTVNDEWMSGIQPTVDRDVFIEGNLSVGTDSESFSAQTLTVQPGGKLTIEGGNFISVANEITNNAQATDFIVASGANLIQTDNNAENTGEITVKRETPDVIRLDYILWSSPVEGQGVRAFSSETLWNRIYTYEGSNAYVPVFGSESDPDIDFTSAKGYMFRVPNNWYPDFYPEYPFFTGKFVGKPFNGAVSIPTHPGTYTSIGNPYPSNIDANLLMSTNGISTLYFWVNTPIVDGEYVGNNYATYNLTGGVSNTGEIDGTGVPSGTIAVGQGFIVQTPFISVSFNNSMRVSDAAEFFKTTDSGSHRFWLNLSGENGTEFNQILVGYINGATNQVDDGFDGKMFGYEGSAIYNLIDQEKFTIQGRMLPFEAEDVVPLGFRAIQQGKFTISLAATDGLFAEGQKIYIRDNLLDITHALTDSPYEFESTTGEFNDRFEIVYKEEGTMGTSDSEKNRIDIYKDRDDIVVQSQSEKILSVELYDLNGRMIHRNEKVNSNLYRVKSASKGVIIVKAQSENGTVVTKKTMNN